MPNNIGLSNNCDYATNLGTTENPKYSCINSKNNNASKVIKNEGIIDYLPQENELIRCSEAKEDNGKLYCTKCINNYPFIWSNEYNQDICDDKCSIDSFLKNNWCYKCNDSNNGNEACNSEKGCNYNHDNNEVYCNECKIEYFNYLKDNINICIKCDNIEKGGMEKCLKCYNNNETISCLECQEGFILSEDNQTCLNISEYKDLEQFINCKKISLDENNKYKCTKCKDNYSLLKLNNNITCINNDYIISPNSSLNEFCEEIINIGTENLPKYSCKKCLNNDIYIKIKYYENKGAYCDILKNYKSLNNCSEAIRKEENNNIHYICTKCIDDKNKIIYDKETNSNICKIVKEKICLSKNCKECKENNENYCSKCLSIDYEVNYLTGDCVKKSEILPAIIWKDIFNFQIICIEEIKGNIICHPSLNIIGITNNEINTGHAFLIYLILRSKYIGNNRYLEEDKKIPTICKIKESVSKTYDNINLVEYNCLGNTKEKDNLTNYNLNNIEESNNTEFIENTNLDELISNTELEKLKDKHNSSYTNENLLKTVVFEMNNLRPLIFDNKQINFTLEGKINKKLESNKINTNIQLLEIKNKTANCTFNIKEEQKANLNCIINIDKL